MHEREGGEEGRGGWLGRNSEVLSRLLAFVVRRTEQNLASVAANPNRGNLDIHLLRHGEEEASITPSFNLPW